MSLRSPFREVRATVPVHLLPSRKSASGNVKDGVDEGLNSHLMQYREELGGVVLSYSDVELCGREAPPICNATAAANSKSDDSDAAPAPAVGMRLGMIFLNRPHIHIHVRAKWLVFAPEENQPLLGIVNKVTDDTVGLLCYDAFNVSIPKTELISDYEYDASGVGEWRHRSDSDAPVITLRTKVVFVVCGKANTVSDGGSYFYIAGSLRRAGARVIGQAPPLVVAASGDSVALELGASIGRPAGAPPAAAKPAKTASRKKRSTLFDDDYAGDTAAATAATPNAGATTPIPAVKLETINSAPAAVAAAAAGGKTSKKRKAEPSPLLLPVAVKAAPIAAAAAPAAANKKVKTELAATAPAAATPAKAAKPAAAATAAAKSTPAKPAAAAAAAKSTPAKAVAAAAAPAAPAPATATKSKSKKVAA